MGGAEDLSVANGHQIVEGFWGMGDNAPKLSVRVEVSRSVRKRAHQDSPAVRVFLCAAGPYICQEQGAFFAVIAKCDQGDF